MFFAAGSTGTVTVGGDWGLIVHFLDLGMAGIILICLITGRFIVTRRELDRADREHVKAMEEKDAEIQEYKTANFALRGIVENQIIPTLVRSNQLAADYAQDLAAERRRRNGPPTG